MRGPGKIARSGSFDALSGAAPCRQINGFFTARLTVAKPADV
jgi:hypothetical protein